MDASTNADGASRSARVPAATLPAISAQTADLLLRQQCPADLVALYLFYLYTASWQHTNRPKATTKYCARGLNITRERVRRAKSCLIELGLIEDYVARHRQSHRIEGWYVHVKYIRTGKSQPSDFPTAGVFQDEARSTTNASSADKENASNAFNKNALKTPNPLSGGDENNLDSIRTLTSKLLTILDEDPQRDLTAAEIRALHRVKSRLDATACEQLQWFYEPPSDPDRPYDPDERFLRLRKQTLRTLANDLPQQIALAAKWVKDHPIWRPPPSPPAPPGNWRELLHVLYPNAVFSHFEQLPDFAQEEIRKMASA
jgi:hypothetical protein